MKSDQKAFELFYKLIKKYGVYFYLAQTPIAFIFIYCSCIIFNNENGILFSSTWRMNYALLIIVMLCMVAFFGYILLQMTKKDYWEGVKTYARVPKHPTLFLGIAIAVFGLIIAFSTYHAAVMSLDIAKGSRTLTGECGLSLQNKYGISYKGRRNILASRLIVTDEGGTTHTLALSIDDFYNLVAPSQSVSKPIGEAVNHYACSDSQITADYLPVTHRTITFALIEHKHPQAMMWYYDC